MIQFEGKISGHSDYAYSGFYAVGQYPSMNNISRTGMSLLSNNYKSSRNPFIIGGSKLDGRSTFSKGERFFIGNTLSKIDEETGEIAFNNRNDNSRFNNDLYIRFGHGSTTAGAYFIFDSVNNEFPSKIKLEMHPAFGEGEVFTKIYDITSSMTWVNFYFEDSNYHEAYLRVTVLDWNKENRPARIEAVFITPIIKINKSSLQSLERYLSSSSSCKEPTYGVISNNAQLTVLDIDGRIKSLMEDEVLNGPLHVEINLVDTLSGVSDHVLKYDASEFSYDNNNLTLSVSMTDGLEALQDEDIGYIAVDKNTSLAQTIKKFVAPYSVAFISIDEELYNIYSSKDYVYSGTVWDNLNQLCNSNCIKAYINEHGAFVFRKMV